MKARRILVVGAGGFIGSHVARRLEKSEHSVHHAGYTNLTRLPPDGAVCTVDCADRASVDRVFEAVEPQIVLNFMQTSPAHTHRPGFMGQGYLDGVKAMVNLLEASRNAGVERFVHACSSTVYADVGAAAMHEATALSPHSVRGLCKLTERNLCMHYAGTGQLSVVLGRVFRAYGPEDRDDKLIQVALARQARGLPVQLPATDSRRDYVYIDDVAEAFFRLALRPLDSGTEVNIGSGEEHTASELLDVLERVSGSPFARQVGGYMPHDVDRAHWRADIRRARSLLDWRPRVSLEAGLRETVSWFRGSASGDARSDESGVHSG